MTDDRRIPLVPLVLGLGGLIPFALLSLAAALDLRTMTLPNLPELARHALALYGATIIAFLGGIRWGQAVQDPDQDRARIHYAISVLPQLAAWGLVVAFQLFGLGRAICFGGLVAIVALSGVADYAFATVGGAPLWFGRLRIILSAGATLALALAAV